MTPRPANWAMARSRKTMPRCSTRRPSGMWVMSTRRPAASGGASSAGSSAALSISVHPGEQFRYRRVEQAEQVVALGVAADGERQHDRLHPALAGEPFAGARGLIGSTDD